MSTTETYILPPQNDDDLTVTASSSGGDYPEAPTGQWVGLCVDVVYRGKQPNKFDASKPDVHKISIHMMLDTYDESDNPVRRTDGKRFVLSAWFTRSMHEKATLRKTLAAWRGKDFDDAQAETFNLNDLVGAYGLVNVIEVKTQAGKAKSVIGSITRLPRGMEKFAPDEYVRIRDRKPGEQHHDAPHSSWHDDVPAGDEIPYNDNDLPF